MDDFFDFVIFTTVQGEGNTYSSSNYLFETTTTTTIVKEKDMI